MRVALSSVRVEEPRHTILDGSRAACSSSYESGSCRTCEHSALAQGEHQRRSVTPRRARVSVDRTTGFDNRRHHCKREKPNSAGLLPAKRPPQSPAMQREVHPSTGIDVPGDGVACRPSVFLALVHIISARGAEASFSPPQTPRTESRSAEIESVERAVAANSFDSLHSKRPQRSLGHCPRDFASRFSVPLLRRRRRLLRFQ
jgi:hypothetical protein